MANHPTVEQATNQGKRQLPESSGWLWNLLGLDGLYTLYDERTGTKRTVWLSRKNRRAIAALE